MTLRALLVEDDPAWRELLEEMLEDAGFVPQPANSLEAALDLLQDSPIDLALVDVSLESADHDNQDGLRVLEHFRARYPQAPAIILTAYATVDLAVRALTTLDADDLLRKEQFNRQRFQETMQRVLGSAPSFIPTAPTHSFTASPGTSRPLEARILVVEDNPAWQSIYEELLAECGAEMEMAISYGEARGLLQREEFDAAVVDLRLVRSTEPEDNRDGFFLLRLTQEVGLPTVVVSAQGDMAAIDRAYEEFGVFAFLDKEGFHRATFLQTLREAVAQQTPVPPTLTSPSASYKGTPLAELTDRQLEVLALLVQGKTNNEIADELIVSVNTVKKHVLAIFAALGVNTRAAAAGVAARYGLR